MNIDFLHNACREPERSDSCFGLCDDEQGRAAYSDLNNADRWIATVHNPYTVALTFTPVDKCLMQDADFPGRERCDGILTSHEHLYFVELKNQKSSWIQQGISQLESTIQLFAAAHDLNQFRHKKAFVCNKRGHFQEIDNAQNLAFFRKYKVRLDIQSNILVVS